MIQKLSTKVYFVLCINVFDNVTDFETYGFHKTQKFKNIFFWK